VGAHRAVLLAPHALIWIGHIAERQRGDAGAQCAVSARQPDPADITGPRAFPSAERGAMRHSLFLRLIDP
jgi:hypothetical protein